MAFTTPGHAYTHTQSEASTAWTVIHNLNNLSPIVSVVLFLDGVYKVVIPASITVLNANGVSIEFTQAVSGTARIV